MKPLKHTLFKLMLIGGLLLGADAASADRWGRGNGHDRHWAPAPAWSYYGGPRYRYGNSDRFSLSLNFGSPGYTSGSVNYGNVYRPAPVIVRPARPVIIERNAYVTGGAPSLFRDRYGRCYERSFNSLGTEIRSEIPASACNF